MFVKIARLIPHVSECINIQLALEFRFDSPENIPASNSGQHQLPTKAGAEQIIVTIAQTVLLLSFTSISSVASAGISSTLIIMLAAALEEAAVETTLAVTGGPVLPNNLSTGGPQLPVVQSSWACGIFF